MQSSRERVDPIAVHTKVLLKEHQDMCLLEAERDKAGSDREDAAAAEFTYGLTGDWAAGIEEIYITVSRYRGL